MKLLFASIALIGACLGAKEGVRVARIAWREETEPVERFCAVASIAALYGTLVYFGGIFSMRILTEVKVDVL